MTWSPPYVHSISSSANSVNLGGCGTAHALLPKWSPLTGRIAASASTSAKSCATQYGVTGSSSSASGGGSLSLSFPIRVGSAGNHTFATKVTITLGTNASHTVGGCPAPNVPYPQPSNSWNWAECASGTSLAFSVSASLWDLDNYFWGGNGSGFQASSGLGWMNYTYCDNWVGQGPSCANTTGGWNVGGISGANAPGYASFVWNGSTSLVLWTNGTGMVRSHHYDLVLAVSLSDSASVTSYNLLGHWKASAKASIDMASLAHALQIISVTIK